VILSAVYMLWMFQRVNYGPVTNAKNRGLRDLSVREWCVIAPVCAAAIFMGVFPGVFLRPMEASVKRTIEHIVPTRPINAQNSTGSRHWAPGANPLVPDAQPPVPEPVPGARSMVPAAGAK